MTSTLQQHDACLQQRHEYRDLKSLIIWVLVSLVLLTLMTVVVGIYSGSLSMDAIAVDAGASLVLHASNLAIVIIVLRQNSFTYPYGTGKLENFSGFFFAVLALPGALFIVVSTFQRFQHPPQDLSFALPQLVLILWLIRDLVLASWSYRIYRRYQDCSPLNHTYLVISRYNLVSSVVILAGLAVGAWFSGRGNAVVANFSDLVIAVLIAVYLGYSALKLLLHNFKSLIDLPLPEQDQLAILKALIENFDSFEGIGNIYSQLSGSTRMVQIELYLAPDTSVFEIEQLRERVETRLRGQFGKLLFHLIPLVGKQQNQFPCAVPLAPFPSVEAYRD